MSAATAVRSNGLNQRLPAFDPSGIKAGFRRGLILCGARHSASKKRPGDASQRAARSGEENELTVKMDTGGRKTFNIMENDRVFCVKKEGFSRRINLVKSGL